MSAEAPAAPKPSLTAMSGTQKAAALLVAIGEQRASEIVRQQDGFGRKLWRLTSAYYSSEEWRSAWAMTAWRYSISRTMLSIGVFTALRPRSMPGTWLASCICSNGTSPERRSARKRSGD